MPKNPFDVEDQPVNVKDCLLRLDASGEHQNLTQELRPFCCAGFQSVHRLESVALADPSPNELQTEHNRCQNVVQVVRDTTGKIADVIHPLRAKELASSSRRSVISETMPSMRRISPSGPTADLRRV